MNTPRVLVFAPHPDDEVIGCGGLLAALRDADARVRVIVVSDGLLGLPPGTDTGLRKNECLAGLAILGVADVAFWDFPDGHVPQSGNILSRYREEASTFQPDVILLPAPTEGHADHRRVTRGVIRALEGQWHGLLRFYETMQLIPQGNAIEDISEHIEKKLAALAAHQSQAVSYDYASHVQGLSALRGATIGAAAAECFLAFEWDGSRQNFFENRPLISVIIRASRMSMLRHALASLLAQTYDQIQVVLVWHGEGEPDLSGFECLEIDWLQGEASRARNLNLGLAAAHGEFIAFLDEDDIFLPDHLALLLVELRANNRNDIAHSRCALIACRQEGEAVIAEKEIEVLGQAVKPGRLLIGNTMPFNSLLFRASIFRGLAFDESLEAYEDWDMLIRLERAGHHFAFVDEKTCEYRLYDVHSLEESHQRKGYQAWRARIMDKVAKDLRPEELERLATLIDNLESGQRQLEGRLEEKNASTQNLTRQLEQSNVALDYASAAARLIGLPLAGRTAVSALAGQALAQVEMPLFSLIVPVCDTPPDILAETLQSVFNQHFPGWELCVVDDASTRADTLEALKGLRATHGHDKRFRFARRDERGGIVAASRDAYAMSRGRYIAFLDHDDRITPEALLEVALLVLAEPETALVYTDSNRIDIQGQILDEYHKPEWSPETLLHLNYVNHLTVVRRDRFDTAGGLRPGFDGSQDWDMLLRLSRILSPNEIRHLPKPLYDWRATVDSLAYRDDSKPYAMDAAIRAMREHIEALGIANANVEINPDGPGLDVQWDGSLQTVQIIIPTHSNAAGLAKCIEGLKQTDYPNFTVTVVDNRASLPEMRELLSDIGTLPGFTVIEDQRPFNWAAINNAAAARNDAPWLLFLNDDVELPDPAWLRRMVRYLDLPEVGAVGATLTYGNGDLQHNGIITDPEWVASNITNRGVKQQLTMNRNVSAVTGACMLTRRDVFNACGGFDERFAVSYNDVDYCLHLRKLGYRIVQATDARAVHHESRSRGHNDTPEKKQQWQQELELMRNKWGGMLEERLHPSYRAHFIGTRILSLTRD